MIDEGTVLHVARLARLALEPGEVQALRAQLGRILAHMEQLEVVSVDGVEPTFHPLGDIAGVTRPDVSRPGLALDVVMDLPAEVEGALVKVPGMMDTGGGKA